MTSAHSSRKLLTLGLKTCSLFMLFTTNDQVCSGEAAMQLLAQLRELREQLSLPEPKDDPHIAHLLDQPDS